MSELPLNDKPPRVLVDQRTLDLLERMTGAGEAAKAIEEMNLHMPGVKSSLTAIKSKINEMRCVLFTRLQLAAQKAKVDFDEWVVVGIIHEGKVRLVKFKSMAEIDKEQEEAE